MEKALPSGALRFVAVPPCRLADTRDPAFTGAFGPPSLVAAATRDFPVAGHCGVASTAQAVSLNVTVVNPDRPGFIGIWPGGDPQPSPLVSSLNYVTGQVVPNAVIAPLGSTGAMTVVTVGKTDLILDVNGYYDVLVPVESLNGLSGALTLQAGPNVAVTPSGQTLTISAAGGGGGTITGVGAGEGLTGGGTSGSVSLAVASQGITSGMIASGAVGSRPDQQRAGAGAGHGRLSSGIDLPDDQPGRHRRVPGGQPATDRLLWFRHSTARATSAYYTSITIGADGLGLISYYDDTNGDLKVAHCSERRLLDRDDGHTRQHGQRRLLHLDHDRRGRPRPHQLLRPHERRPEGGPLQRHRLLDRDDRPPSTARATSASTPRSRSARTASASSATTTTPTATSRWPTAATPPARPRRLATLDSTGDVGQYTSITIGADGLGLISYYDATNGDLKVAHCSNAACSTATTATLDSTGDVGRVHLDHDRRGRPRPHQLLRHHERRPEGGPLQQHRLLDRDAGHTRQHGQRRLLHLDHDRRGRPRPHQLLRRHERRPQGGPLQRTPPARPRRRPHSTATGNVGYVRPRSRSARTASASSATTTARTATSRWPTARACCASRMS